jgi:flagellar biosynthesis/type III secretory pathway chaperone
VDREPRVLAQELVTCLKRQAESLNQFLDLLARQQTALVARNHRDLDKITLELEVAVTQSQRLESTRKALTSRLAAALSSGNAPTHGDGSDEKSSLAELAGLVAASEASDLAAVQSRLRGLHQEIERRRRLNAALIGESLRCTGETLRWIASGSQKEPTYSQAGGSSGAHTQLAVNRRC